MSLQGVDQRLQARPVELKPPPTRPAPVFSRSEGIGKRSGEADSEEVNLQVLELKVARMDMLYTLGHNDEELLPLVRESEEKKAIAAGVANGLIIALLAIRSRVKFFGNMIRNSTRQQTSNSRHKLLTCKLMVLNSTNGDLVTERTFVDVLNMNVALGRTLVLLNNQVNLH